MKKKLLIKLKKISTIGLALALGISCLSGSFALPVQAAEEGKYSTYFGSSNEDNHIAFDGYKGMYLRVSGTRDGQSLSNLPAFCVEKGLPFRSMVSDLEQCKIEDIKSGTGESLGTYSTMANAIRGYSSLWDSNASGNLLWTQWASKCFVGWGTSADYTINSDWTNVTFNRSADADLTNIPSSSIISETFDMDDEDEENDNYNNRSDYSGQFVPGNFTGHEGSKPVYATYLKEVVWPDNMTESKKNALAYVGYFILEDESTVNTYSAATRYEVAQALTWATEFGFMDTKKTGNNTIVTFHSSTGKYTGGSLTGTCDEYVKHFIGNDYDAMKLYREFVWKVKNANEIPSFSYDSQLMAKRNPITLHWDARENAYVAVIADEKMTVLPNR